MVKKLKVARTRLPSVGFRSWSRFLAVSVHVTWVINPAVGCHYFPPGLQLPPQSLRGLLYQFRCLVNRGTMGVNSLPKTVTRQRRDGDLNPGHSAPESSTLTLGFRASHPDTSRKLPWRTSAPHTVCIAGNYLSEHLPRTAWPNLKSSPKSRLRF